ncbi:MAG: filamentous hemagglutinin N-terminal domain-containing protein [Phycisphaerales bacterium]
MIDRDNSVHQCSPGNDRGLSRAERRRALRALRKRRRLARPVRFGLLGAAAFLAAAGVAQPVYAQRGVSGMSGANVVHGDVSFRRTRGGMTITASDGSIIEFERFNIPKRGFVRFNQPGVDATVLNRVVGPGASLIQGTLVANGQVFLVNPSGVTFGPGARVNVGALYAVGGQLSNADFRRGIRNFTDLSGSVVNQGVISAERGVHMAGSSIQNSGSIVASRGVVTLSAGDNVFLAEQGSSVMVRIDAPGAVGETTVPAPEGGVGVENSGSVAGGAVLFSTGDLHSLAIRNEGRVTATGGSVTIDSAGAARNSGVIDASDTSAGGTGGEVRLLGETVVQSGVIDASGDRAGGTVMVGGNFRGQGPERNAETTVITGDSVIRADAVTSGDGGRIAIWGTDGAYVGGELSTRQGEFGGTGGFVETSSDALLLSARVDTGVGGSFLVDPVDLTIGGGPEADPLPDSGDFNFDDAESSISANTVEAVLESGGSLILEAQNNIVVTNNINSAGGDADGDLTLRAGKGIAISNNVSITTDANITLQANYYEDGPSATNEIIAAGRTAGDAVITLGSQVDITAGGTLSIEVRPTATPLAANGDPVGVSFAVGDITLGSAANNANRVDLVGADVNVVVPNGLITNADVTGTTSILLHAGADGTGTHDFAPAADRVTLDGAAITLRAGDGSGAEVVDLSVNDPDIVNATSLLIRQDGAVTSAQLLDGARIGPGLAGFDYTLQSDNGAITLGDRTRLANADLTLNAKDGVTLGANAGSSGLNSLTIDGDTDVDGTGNVAIDSAVSLTEGLQSSGVDFGTTGAITATSGNVDIEHTGDVTIGATVGLTDGSFESTGAAFTGGGIDSTNNLINITHTGQVDVTGTMSGQAVELRSTGAGVDIGANLSSPNAVSVRADGGITFSAATILASPVIELVATGAASVVDFSVNAPTVRGVGLNAPTEFLQGQGPDMTQADLLAAGNFDQGLPSSYTLESAGSIEISDATLFNNTTLFLIADGDVTLGGGDYTLNGLNIQADRDGDDTGSVLITENVTVAGGQITSSGVNFTSTTATKSLISDLLTLNHTGDVAIASGSRVTLGASTVGGNLTLSVDNQDLLSTTAIDQLGGTALSVGGFADLTATGLVTAINLDSADVTGQVRLSTPGDATVISPGALTLGASNVGGGLTATAQDGDLTLADAVGVTGAASLTASGTDRDLVGGVNLLQTSTDVTLSATQDITISRDVGGAVTLSAGRNANVTLTSTDAVTLGASTVGGNLTLTGSGPVSSANTVDITGDASLTVNTGAVLPFAIDFADLNVGQTLSLNTDGVAQVESTAGGLTLGASNVGVALRLVANGAIGGSGALVEVGKGALVIPGAVTVLEANSINLAGLDSVVPIALTTTGDATLTNAGAIVFNGATVGGALDATATAGSITDDGGIVVTGDATFTATGVGGAITLDSTTVNGATSLAATGAVSYTSPNPVRILAFSAGADSVIEASDIDFTGAADSVGASAAGVDLALRPSLATLSVGIGDDFSADLQNFTLSGADLTKLADGFNSITIGRTDAFTSSLILGNDVVFRDAAIIRRPTDALQTTTVNAGITGVGDASISLFGAAAGVTNLTGEITTEGGAISITGETTLAGTSALRTTNGGAAGGDISTGVIATVAPGSNALTIDAGDAGTVTTGDIGAGGPLASFTLGGATTATLGVVNAAGAIAFTADSLNAGAITSNGNQAITFTTDALTLTGPVGTQGDLVVQTRTAARDIGVGVAVGGLDLTGATFTNLFVGADRNTVTIGRANGAGDITIGAGGLTLGDTLLVRSPSGEILVDGELATTGAASLTLAAQTIRLRDSVYTDTGDLTANGAISVEAPVDFGSLFGGGAIVTVGPIDATAEQNFAIGGNGDTTLVLTGDIGSSGALGFLDVFADSGLRIGAPSVSITSNGMFAAAAIDSVAGQTNALTLTMVGGGSATLEGVIGGSVLADPATLSSFTINGDSTLSGGLVRTTGAQAYTGDLTLGGNTLFEGATARFENGMSAGGFDVDVDGAATLAGGTFTAQSLDLLGATRVEGASTITGGTVRFASTLDGVTANSGALTLDSTARFEGRVGDTARVGSLTAGDATVATDVVDVADLDFNGTMTIDAPALAVRGTTAMFDVVETTGGSALTVESGSATFSDTVGAANALASLTVDGDASLGAGQIRTSGAQSYAGAVTLTANTELISTGGGAIDFDSTVNGARTLTLSTTGLSTLGGNVGQTTALLGVNTSGALRIEGAQNAVGAADFGGAVTIANSAVTITGSTVRFGGPVASVNGQNNSLAVTASGTTRFDSTVGAGVGELGTLLLNGGGVTVLNTGAIDAMVVDFDDAVQVDATSITIDANDIRFDNSLASVVGESNSITLNAGTTRFGGAVSGLSNLTTDAPGTTTIATSSISASQVNFGDDVTLAASNITVGGSAVRFVGGVTSQSAGSSSLTVNANTTFFGDTVGVGGRLNNLVTNAAGTTTINGSQVAANTIAFNDAVTVNGASLLLDAATITLNGMDAGTGVSPSVAINSNALTINGAVGATKELGSLTTDAAGTTTINGSVATSGAQVYNDAVTLAGAVSGSSVDFAQDLAVGAGASVDAADGARFLANVGGAGDLTVSATTVEFARAIGALDVLGSLSVTGDTTLAEGSVTTTGAQTFNGTLRLSSDTTFNGEDVSIIGTLRSSDPAVERVVLINDAGETLLSGDFDDLVELRTDGAGRTSLAGDFEASDFLFADDVVLVGDTTINATGDSGIVFLGRIDSDSALTPRTLTLDIDRNVIADIEAGLAPGESLEDAIRERLLVEQRPLPTISFGDDIGATHRLAELLLNTGGTRVDPAVYATIVGVSRLDDGRVSVTSPIDLTINTGRFEMGRNEKFTVLGNLTLNAGAEARLGDLTVADTLRVNVDAGGQIVLLVREIGSLLAPAEDAEDVLGLVDGAETLDRVDIVAGGQVLFNADPVLDMNGVMLDDETLAVISGSGSSSGNVLNDDVVLFRLFPRLPIALEDLVLRLEDGEVFGQDAQPLLFGQAVIDVVLDFTSDGLTLADTSGLEGVTGLFAETAAGVIQDQVLLSQSVRDRLERVGLSARDPLMSELAQALGGRAVYNDYSSEASASDSIGQYAGEIVVNRLPRGAAEQLVAQFDALVGADDERLNAFKAALADAYITYYDEAPDEMLDDPRLLAAGFATRVSTTQPGSEVDQGLLGVAELLRRIEDIGVTRFEYERALQAVLTTFTPDPDMTLEEFRVVVEWYKTRLVGAPTAARTPASTQTPDGAEASS